MLIHELLPKVSTDVGHIAKENTNQQQRFKFRSVDDVLSHCGPALRKHGVSVSVQVREHDVTVTDRQRGDSVQTVYHCRLSLAVTFWAPDGSCLENEVAAEGLDYAGDKATAKAQSAAFKQAFFFSLCIPVDERAIPDSDRDSDQGSVVSGQAASHAVPGASNTDSRHGAEVSAFAKARAALENAPDIGTLSRYMLAVEGRIGEFSAEQFKQLEELSERRSRQLSGREKAGAT